jgi:septal ring factor EnvC (AmiA/AmiB activator)
MTKTANETIDDTLGDPRLGELMAKLDRVSYSGSVTLEFNEIMTILKVLRKYDRALDLAVDEHQEMAHEVSKLEGILFDSREEVDTLEKQLECTRDELAQCEGSLSEWRNDCDELHAQLGQAHEALTALGWSGLDLPKFVKEKTHT